MKVGIIGCGNISTVYVQNFMNFDHIQLLQCADINQGASEKLCKLTETGQSVSIEELLENPEIELVVNLTPPVVHAEVSRRILESSKHLYSEKPFALDTASAKMLLDLAKERSLAIGCAPDTFLGFSVQHAKALIDDGAIGTPLAFTASMTTAGHERWHPNPDFYYKQGGGPLWDMGPYYLSALVECLGKVAVVQAIERTSDIERVIKTGERAGQSVSVETPTTIHTMLSTARGVVGYMLMSFDIAATNLPHIEIYGTEGTLQLPDPNFFGGVLKLYSKRTEQWKTIDPRGLYIGNNRGLGIEQMCAHLEEGTSYTNDGQFAYHIVEILENIFRSAQSHAPCKIE